MELMFCSILERLSVDPHEVRLLRHRSQPFGGRTPYSLWRDDRPGFLTWQSIQAVDNRSRLGGRYWASFVVTPAQSTLFVGLYKVELIGLAPPDLIDPLRLTAVGEADLYSQEEATGSSTFAGRVSVAWGTGARAWIQRADSQAKPILEIVRVYQEETFPGYGRFICGLSLIELLPTGWLSALRAARGVYLLTCPRTREQYVGSATGEGGFLGRWLSYVQDGHGGNVGLKSRDPSDYQVSILEVSGSTATVEDILAAEQLWKAKLQSREMGLNRN